MLGEFCSNSHFSNSYGHFCDLKSVEFWVTAAIVPPKNLTSLLDELASICKRHFVQKKKLLIWRQIQKTNFQGASSTPSPLFWPPKSGKIHGVASSQKMSMSHQGNIMFLWFNHIRCIIEKHFCLGSFALTLIFRTVMAIFVI